MNNAPDTLIGRTFGAYRILEPLGAGGMGVVYRARDEQLERDVAVKVLPAGLLVDDTARKRFRREALALSRLNHQNIATVYAFGNEAGVDYLAMELVAGASLQQKLTGGALQEKEILALAGQIAAALEEAHEHDVIHRDLKPGNIMVTPRGTAKVLDFGLARVLQPEGPAAETMSGATQSAALTHAIVGTPAYMSPEQVRGDAVDARSDLYALGCVLYEMATGSPVFREDVATRLVEAILHRAPVALRARNERISPELERITLKCLEKDPDRRYQSARELAVDLRRLAEPSAVSAALPAGPAGVQRARNWRRAAAIAAVLAVALGGGLALGLNFGKVRTLFRAASAPAPIESLVVLPLENLSGDPQQDYLADSMTEELTTDLARISSLQVISRASAMQYKGKQTPLPQIGSELKVDALVQGSVRRADRRVRISASLVRASSAQQVWANSYDGDMSDVLSLETSVAREIAGEIKVALTPSDRARLVGGQSVNPAVYDAYLRAMHHDLSTEANAQQAISDLKQALILDPKFALGYTGLAKLYMFLGDFYVRPTDTLPNAKAAALHAIELDDTLAESYRVLAKISFTYDWDWAAAERQFKRALELDPSLTSARMSYSQFLAAMRRPEEARANISRAAQLDPLSSGPFVAGMWVDIMGRQYKEAMELGRAALRLDPDDGETLAFLSIACAQQGEFDQAVMHAEKVDPNENPFVLSFVGSTFAAAGKREKALALLAKVKAESSKQYVCPYEVGTIHLLLGEKDEAFRWYEKAHRDRSQCMPFFGVDPRLDSVRSDSRYQELFRDMKFPF
ncbi:MAG TPA: protein kinase [Candidatus Binatia bacterium]|nr:protein kinase [Candidatus Binatia bacterium]